MIALLVLLAAAAPAVAVTDSGAAGDPAGSSADRARALATPARIVARRPMLRDSVIQLPEVRVDRERPLSPARQRLPTAFVSDLAPRRDARAVETVADVLGEAAGVHVDSYGGLGAFATVSLRGAAPGEVALYLDGEPLTSAAHGVVSLADLPVTAVERIEVYRGVSPLALGAATPGGAVNVVTRAAGAARELRVARGAFGTWEASGTAGGRRGALAGLLHLGYQGSQGDFRYLDDNGTPFNPADDSVHARANDRFDALATLATASWNAGRGVTVGARQELFRKTQGLPGPAAVPTRTAGLEMLRARTQLEVAGDGARLRPAWRLRGALGQEGTKERDALGELGYGRHVTDDRLASRSLALELEWAEPIPRVTLLASGEARAEWQTLRDTADGLADPPESRRLARGASIGARVKPLGEWLTLQAATRWDRIADRPHATAVVGVVPDLDAVHDLTSPQAGVRLAAPGGFEVRANWARAQRAPGFEELFGREGSVLGNPALRPERAESWDAGGSWSRTLAGGRRAAVEWSHFETRSHDLIWYQPTFHYVRATNLAKALVRGEELSVRVSAPRGLSGALAVTWQTAINRTPFPFWNGKLLMLRPGRQAYARLDWRRGGFHAGADLQYLGDDWLDPSNRTYVAERTLVGASIAAPVPGAPLRVVLDGRNLGDRRVSDVAGYPLPGRMLSVALDLGGPAARKGTP